jgi:circadian clock protein KaiB
MSAKREIAKLQPGNAKLSFCLYITGASPSSSRAIANLKLIFERHLVTDYDLEIIDVYQQPQVAQTINLVALPMLVRKFPLPEKKLIGDMSDFEKVCHVLGLNK